MEEIESSSTSRKRILFIILFIVPFLVGMALIFMGKGLGDLPTLHPLSSSEKSSDSYYAIPNLTTQNYRGEQFEISTGDSAIKLFCVFSREDKKEWSKHLMYISKIIGRYKNAKVYSIYEGPYSDEDWKESPIQFIASHECWNACFAPKDKFNELIQSLKLYRDNETGIYPYVIVDKASHIRAYCPINDLKVARDVPNMLKILNNQYVPRRKKIEKGNEEN